MIKFEQRLDKEHKSLWQIQQDGKIIYLNERDLNTLVNEIHNVEKDIIESLPVVEESKSRLESYVNDYNELEDSYCELKEEIDDLKSILDDEGIDY